MVSLEAIKNKYFLDYKKVAKYLEQSKPGAKEVPMSERVRTVSLSAEPTQLNEPCYPLSNTSVNNMSPTVEHSTKKKFY